MKLVQATFTEDEMLEVRNALREETVRMRQHVSRMTQAILDGEIGECHAVGARKVLATLESLLSWAKEKCMR